MKAIRAFPKSRAFKGSGESVFLHKEPEGTLESEGWGEGEERRVSETSSELSQYVVGLPPAYLPTAMSIIK